MPAKCFAFQANVLLPVHLPGAADLPLLYWKLHRHKKSSIVFFSLSSRIKTNRVFNCFLAQSVINKPPKASAQIVAPANPGGSLKVMRDMNCLVHFSSLQQSRYKLSKRNALKSFPSRGLLQIHVHEKRVTDLILTDEETAFFSKTMLPKYAGFYISTVSPPERRRKNSDYRKYMKATEYHWLQC